MAVDLLPECRTRETKGSIRSPFGNLIPIFCANCGGSCGMVPEKYITFTFALCDPCSEKHGDIAHTYKEPDTIFWERVKNAQLEEHERLLTGHEILVELDDPTSVLAKLAEEWESRVRKLG